MSTIAPVDSAAEKNSSSLSGRAGMAPAQDRLEARDGAVLESDDRPEQHRDLAALERAAHVVLERLPVGALRAHLRREELDTVAARLFRGGERKLRVREHVAALAVQLRIVARRSDRHGDRDLALAETDRRRQRRAQALDALAAGRAARTRRARSRRTCRRQAEPASRPDGNRARGAARPQAARKSPIDSP